MYHVCTNMDRVAKILSIGALPWTPVWADKSPNRVHLAFDNIECARRLHDALADAKVVVFKNWID